MKEKIELNEKEICDEYVNGNIGTEGLATKYHVGKLRIREILKRNGIESKKRGGQNLKVEFVVSDWKIEKYPEVDGCFYVAVDKVNGFETKDYMNAAGVLTTHIRNVYGVEIPTLYDRRMYYMKTGDYWWEQWFTIESREKPKTKKCPYCDWETIDIENKSGWFEQHLLREHNITKFKYLEEHPEDREYFIGVNPITNRQIETDNNKFVICQVCGKKLARIDNHHLKKHNMTKEYYIEKYGLKNLSSVEYHEKQSQASIVTNTNMTFTKYSKAENEIKHFIENNGLECRTDRTILNGKEIDIFIPSKNIGIEFNGNKWHTEWFGKKDKNYHLSKLLECKKNGVNLISIFEDEYEHHKDIVLKKISHILGIEYNTSLKIYGRNCEVKEIYSYEAEEFLNKYHIQGFVKSSLFIGCFYNEELVGVMSFLKSDDENWELTRLASNTNYVCSGIGGKMFNYFVKNHEYKEIKSFADRRWTIDEKNNIYTKLGFEFEGFVKPSYTYYNPSIDKFKRIHKFNFRKNRILKKHPELDSRMTESEMARELGYDRIWDCGLIKYVYKNPDCNKS